MTLQVRGREIELENVHSKLDCKWGSNDQACPQLIEQIARLPAYAAARDEKGIALIIEGDLNCTLRSLRCGHANAWFYDRLGLSIAPKDLGPAPSSSNGYLIDDQFGSGSHSEILGGHEAYEHAFNGPLESWPSDHCLHSQIPVEWLTVSRPSADRHDRSKLGPQR